ncbi:REXO4 exonuclease, partial [Atractosteus spatula]|nr:REXO4 exonuclease [Atractosteus spatula]
MSGVKLQGVDKVAVTKTRGPNPEEKKNKRRLKEKKSKRKVENGHLKKKKKGGTNVNFILPPKNSQQFSSNWKALQELLNQKKETENQQAESTRAQQIPKKETKKPKKHPKDLAVKDQGSGESQDHHGKQIIDCPLPTTSKLNGDAVPTPQEKRNKVKRKKELVPKETNEKGCKKRKIETSTGIKPREEDIWFDDVDPDDIEAAIGADAAEIVRKKLGIKKSEPQTVDSVLVKDCAFEGLTKTVAMDCEMVGVGEDGEESIVARVSLVNQYGKCIYDKYVKPTERVTDYRTAVSGIRPQDIKNGEDVKVIQKEVSDILRGRILVGHAVHNDLKILFIDHPRKKIRDTQKYKPFKQRLKCSRPSLRHLCEKILNVKVQQGEHSSVQDAQAAMRLYTLVKKQWEAEIKSKYKTKDAVQNEDKGKPKAGTNQNKFHPDGL